MKPIAKITCRFESTLAITCKYLTRSRDSPCNDSSKSRLSSHSSTSLFHNRISALVLRRRSRETRARTRQSSSRTCQARSLTDSSLFHGTRYLSDSKTWPTSLKKVLRVCRPSSLTWNNLQKICTWMKIGRRRITQKFKKCHYKVCTQSTATSTKYGGPEMINRPNSNLWPRIVRASKESRLNHRGCAPSKSPIISPRKHLKLLWLKRKRLSPRKQKAIVVL